MAEIPFYEDGYVGTAKMRDDIDVDTGNPVTIYHYLIDRVYKQDRYCRDAAMILYDHLQGITSRNIVCGPPGCGKTFVWNCLKEIFPRIIIVDASNITKDGWSGGDKVKDFLQKVDFRDPDYIIVFDEFDKCAAPMYSKHDENVSAAVQSEFLKLVEGVETKYKRDGDTLNIDTSRMSFVFCGSFAMKAEEIAESESSSGFGFENQKKEAVYFEKELTVSDLIEFGVIPELASRCTRLINVRPLTTDDYIYLITEFPGSPLKILEEKYGMELDLTDDEKRDIAVKAYESGLGIRNVSAQVQRMMDDKIFAQFMSDKEKTGDETEMNEVADLDEAAERGGDGTCI